MQRLDDLFDDVAATARPHAKRGRVADYIPALAGADPDRFGLAMAGLDGQENATGDADVGFPIQSLSKLFALVLAMQRLGSERGVSEEIWQRVGREPSGDPFNSLVQLEHERGIPRNPMINAGALVIADLLLEHCSDPIESLLELLGELAGEAVAIDESVAAAEEATSQRNRAMGHLMAAFGNLNHPLDAVLDVYNRQCAITMTARQLARASRFLADDGIDPASGREILSGPLARRVMAVMLTCGTYDAAGDFAFSVGLPCKSGVAGGILAVAPDHSGICVWSPPLDAAGNSVAGRVALHELAERLGLSIF
ncbi:glutaminase [Wenzhouxiangella sp. XN79A]|uniref:glutaminase n=1 Tax=Wenzhouxiangella sp. XN79A TaxID=2724193 RepID=UPI00144A5DF2|nr:glutaminase [Wenzhouxiangella sp. XN79A]NKI34787.1 glutaminase [Wenzhouxiangella sp. XN79A]